MAINTHDWFWDQHRAGDYRHLFHRRQLSLGWNHMEPPGLGCENTHHLEHQILDFGSFGSLKKTHPYGILMEFPTAGWWIHYIQKRNSWGKTSILEWMVSPLGRRHLDISKASGLANAAVDCSVASNSSSALWLGTMKMRAFLKQGWYLTWRFPKS